MHPHLTAEALLIGGTCTGFLASLGFGARLLLARQRERFTLPASELPLPPAPWNAGPMSGRPRLPTAGEVTGELEKLARPCPSCDDPMCIDFACEAVEGVVVGVPHVAAYRAQLSALAERMEEEQHHWHWNAAAGSWEPPRALLAALDPASWLYGQLVAA